MHIAIIGDSTVNGDGNDHVSWVDYLASRRSDWDIAKHGIDGSTYSSNFASIAERASSYDIQGVVAVLGGINDFNRSIPLGTKDDCSNETFWGAANLTYRKLSEKTDPSNIIVMTPMRSAYKTCAGKYQDSDKLNKLGFSFDEYVCVLKAIAESKGMRLFDLSTHEKLNPLDEKMRTEYFAEDGIHPNAAGYKLLSTEFEQWVVQEFPQ